MNIFDDRQTRISAEAVPPEVAAGGLAAVAGVGVQGRIEPAGVDPAVQAVRRLGSILPCRTRQRKVAWICELGQPNRS